KVRLIWFALCTGVLLALIPLLGPNVLFMVMFQAMTHVLLLPWRWALPSMLLMSLTVLVLAFVLRVPIAAGLAVMGTVMAWGIGYGVRQQMLQEELEAAQQRNAVLAVAAERERIGRDLHDLVGHSLTSLTISAQLARRLLDKDPEAARAQLEHIEATVRQALADVRATASGMQHVRAATEIASARTVLATVGIQAEVPTALPPLHDDLAELFGYVIREGVTNIVRHSRATCAEITVDEHSVTVEDDGVGIPQGAERSGLRGLEARVALAGGRLEVRSSETGTRLAVRVGEERCSASWSPTRVPSCAPAWWRCWAWRPISRWWRRRPTGRAPSPPSPPTAPTCCCWTCRCPPAPRPTGHPGPPTGSRSPRRCRARRARRGSSC